MSTPRRPRLRVARLLIGAIAVFVAASAAGLAAAPAQAYAGGAVIMSDINCVKSAVQYEQLTADRDNSGNGSESYDLSVTDSAGTVLYSFRSSQQLGYVFIPSTSFFAHTSTAAPGPIRVQMVSPAGNGFPEQIIWDVTGTCAPTATPTATPGAISGPQDTLITGVLRGSPTPDSFQVVTAAAHGVVTSIDSTGQFSYFPNPGYVGVDSFAFRTRIGSLWSAPATMAITISSSTPVGDAQSLAGNANTAIPGFLRATDPTGKPLTFQIASDPTSGTVTLDPPTGAFIYTPVTGFHGVDSFTFTATNGAQVSEPATITLALAYVPTPNNPPTATPSVASGTVGSPITGTVSATDLDSDPVTFAIDTHPASGTVILDPATGAFTYVPNAGFVGDDSFTFRASDGVLTSAPATVSLTVTGTIPTPTGPGSPPAVDGPTSSGAGLAATGADSVLPALLGLMLLVLGAGALLVRRGLRTR